jgi:hypothetical protein
MTVGYKSQGAGVSVNGTAAIAPAWPAVVDAGDIAVMHIVYRGTAEAPPANPGGFELLNGPNDIGTTTVAARHWVYGKIAVGDEDSTTVSLGTTGTAIEKAARVHTFDGRISGSISDLVRGFSSISHANRIQGPQVTTTVAGALAACAGAQADNNTAAAFGAVTGGTWAEAVAEYSVALTTGLMLQLQIATPTADPGTIGPGGTAGSANDPSGAIGFEIRPSLPPEDQGITPAAVTVTATPGSLSAVRQEQVVPGVVTVTVSTGSLIVSLSGGEEQAVSPVAAAVTATPGSVSVVPDRAVVPSAVDVTVSPGSLVVSPPDQTVIPVSAVVDVSAGVLSIVREEQVVLDAPTIDVVPGEAILQLGIPVVSPEAVTITVAAGIVTVLPVRKTKWMARMEEPRWRAQLKPKRRPTEA